MVAPYERAKIQKNMNAWIVAFENFGTEFPPSVLAVGLGSVLLVWISYKFFKFEKSRFPNDFWAELILFCVLQFSFLLYSQWLSHRPILTALQNHTVWSRPAPKQSLDLGLIHAGERVRVLEKLGSDWILIRYKESGEMGYVETKHYEN